MATSIVQFRVDDDLKKQAPREDDSANKALGFMEELNKSASENGVDEMSLDELNSEISSFRAERRVRG